MSAKIYRVNEVFYSLQGEGFWTGTPMVFVRLSGCNLQCPFCDTDHASSQEMTADEIVQEASNYPTRRVCITGGEPLLQLDAALTEAIHTAGFSIHLETNGTRAVPAGVDWVTVSPKEDVMGLKGNGKVVLESAQEVKLVYEGHLSEARLSHWAQFPAQWHFLQPCAHPVTGEANIAQTVDYILAHPVWRLSLQTHKLLHIR